MNYVPGATIRKVPSDTRIGKNEQIGSLGWYVENTRRVERDIGNISARPAGDWLVWKTMAMAKAEFWRKRKRDFTELAAEEYSAVPDPADSRRLRTSGDYTDGQVGGIGRWRLNDGPNADFLAHFQEAATWAGGALGPPPGVNPLEFWLHRLFQDLLETEGPRDDIGHLAIGQRDQGGIIRDVCQASATFCSRLARGALEREVETSRNEASNNAAAQTKLAHDLTQKPPHRRPKSVRRHPRYLKIDVALREVADMRPKSHEEVFRSLDQRQVPFPHGALFEANRGWLAGFRKDRPRARVWLSKIWSSLNLPPFRRGPKS